MCDTCEPCKAGNITEIDYKTRCDNKEEARKELAKETTGQQEVLTMDLQSVLLSSRLNVSALYYKTKLIVHNFTFYDCKRNNGYCYIWNECEGELTSNKFLTNQKFIAHVYSLFYVSNLIKFSFCKMLVRKIPHIPELLQKIKM